MGDIILGRLISTENRDGIFDIDILMQSPNNKFNYKKNSKIRFLNNILQEPLQETITCSIHAIDDLGIISATITGDFCR